MVSRWIYGLFAFCTAVTAVLYVIIFRYALGQLRRCLYGAIIALAVFYTGFGLWTVFTGRVNTSLQFGVGIATVTFWVVWISPPLLTWWEVRTVRKKEAERREEEHL